jgi:hypothetical protein
MGIAMERLMRVIGEHLQRGLQVLAEHVLRFSGEKRSIVQDGEAFGKDREMRQWLGEGFHHLMALFEREADFTRIRLGIRAGDEFPKIQRVAEMLMRAGWEVGMQRDDGRSVSREMLREGIFTGKPFGALSRAIAILHHAGHESLGEAQNEGAAVLQDVTTVRRDAVGEGGFRGGTDGKGGIWHERVVQFCGSQLRTRAPSSWASQVTRQPAISVA